MANHSPWRSDANHFARPGAIVPRCCWWDCRQLQAPDLPVCVAHALIISDRVREEFTAMDLRAESWEPPQRDSYVYYLMLSPVTVKIGTTANLPARIRQMRTELQYVVALERGGRTVERERHLQFAEERRHKLREDFHLSERLKKHIDSLLPQRDLLMRIATTLTAA